MGCQSWMAWRVCTGAGLAKGLQDRDLVSGHPHWGALCLPVFPSLTRKNEQTSVSPSKQKPPQLAALLTLRDSHPWPSHLPRQKVVGTRISARTLCELDLVSLETVV